MAKSYRLRAGKRDAYGTVPQSDIALDTSSAADRDLDAINMARRQNLDVYLDAGDFVWLTENKRLVWTLKLEETWSYTQRS
jgi:hypothetical protein